MSKYLLFILDIENEFLSKLTIVGRDVRSDYSCNDNTFKLCADENDPDSYFIRDFRKTLRTCWNPEIIRFNEVVDQVFV